MELKNLKIKRETANPELSVVIPTKNEIEYLPRLINQLYFRTFKNFEIIVA